MENGESKKIYLVVTYIKDNGTATACYNGEKDSADCPARVSSITADGAIAIPLWFEDEKSAQEYVEKVKVQEEREYLLIQEFSHTGNTCQDEAKIVFTCNSDTWPTLKQGKTKHHSGIWADVRSIFLFDKSTAFDYVRRFNEDAAAAFNRSRK